MRWQWWVRLTVWFYKWKGAIVTERILTRLFKLEEINGHERCPSYMYRWTLFQPRRPAWLKGFGVYVHKFVGDDWTRDMHDHPKRFISIGLAGRYIEVTPLGLVPATDQSGAFERRTLYSAPWIRTFPATHIHRIELLPDRRPCWTLVIVLKTVREWGFWPKGVWMPWRKYVAPDSQAANDGRLC